MKKQRVKVADVHNWFRGFQACLADRRKEVGLRLAGASAEQWLNTELFAYLAAALAADGTNNLYPYAEYKKRDMTVFYLDSDDAAAIIETKVLYRSYALSSVRNRIDNLSSQLKKARRDNRSSICIGLVFAAFVKSPEVFNTRKSLPASPEEFNARLYNEFRQAKDLKFAKQELFVEVNNVQVGAVKVPKVALYGQYVTLR